MVDIKEQKRKQWTLEIFYTCGSDLKGLGVERLREASLYWY